MTRDAHALVPISVNIITKCDQIHPRALDALDVNSIRIGRIRKKCACALPRRATHRASAPLPPPPPPPPPRPSPPLLCPAIRASVVREGSLTGRLPPRVGRAPPGRRAAPAPAPAAAGRVRGVARWLPRTSRSCARARPCAARRLRTLMTKATACARLSSSASREARRAARPRCATRSCRSLPTSAWW